MSAANTVPKGLDKLVDQYSAAQTLFQRFDEQARQTRGRLQPHLDSLVLDCADAGLTFSAIASALDVELDTVRTMYKRAIRNRRHR